MDTQPLWERLSSDSLIKLIRYQWQNYGLKLDIIATVKVEDIDEIDRLIRQAPHRQRRVTN